PIGLTISLTLAYVGLMLTAGRALMHRSLPFIQAHASFPGGVLGFAVVIAMLGAAFTEWIGIHAIFGSFIVGVALGDSSHLKERTRQTLEGFVTFIFAPLFFATVGLKIDFLANFDWKLVLFVIAIACLGKLVGCGLAARISGMPWRESLAIGAAMNARGAMEIILALLALEAKLINQQLFVALVVMALATSVVAGPIMQWILRRTKPNRFTDFLGSKSFVSRLEVADRLEAMRTLCEVSGATGLTMNEIIQAALAREQLLPTGIGQGIALSHVRLPNLDKPQVALGISRQGIDFDSPDGQPCHTICLILTSEYDQGLGLELYRDAAGTLLEKSLLKKLPRVQTYTEFLALLAEYRGRSKADTLLEPPISERNEVLIIGATATARALAKLLATTRSVQLIDNNATNVAEARAEGLHAVYGNALDIEVLREARAGTAKYGLMMTANAQINAVAARQLHDIFKVPELAAVKRAEEVAADRERLRPLEIATAFGTIVPLNQWDHWFAFGAVVIERIGVSQPEQVAALLSEQRLILAVESGAESDLSPFTSSTQCHEGDTLIVASSKPALQ
ncbi:MAG: cation:proton antiporter, partial [Planctomycetaceae bacterium]